MAMPNITVEHDFSGSSLASDSTISTASWCGDDEVEIALGHLVDLRIEDIFVVDEADRAAPIGP